jgi:hypothetical protein
MWERSGRAPLLYLSSRLLAREIITSTYMIQPANNINFRRVWWTYDKIQLQVDSNMREITIHGFLLLDIPLSIRILLDFHGSTFSRYTCIYTLKTCLDTCISRQSWDTNLEWREYISSSGLSQNKNQRQLKRWSCFCVVLQGRCRQYLHQH